jgi:hypothetical protein
MDGNPPFSNEEREMKTQLINEISQFVKTDTLKASIVNSFKQLPEEVSSQLVPLITDERLLELKGAILGVMEKTYEVEELEILLDIYKKHPFFMDKFNKAGELAQIACGELFQKWVF